ncbi:MAG: SDR family NAD(P)-dependent oxidoreductase, partial [Acidimicrobiia bacterium]|nr:SDR family NAD(P)-dependent oxidoreductase [Acidimicrobiia bacterium]
MDLTGASVLITGASSGIGAALATVLDAHQPTLGLVGRDEARLADTAARCTNATVHQWAMDLGDLAAVDRLADEAWQALGGIDVLVNNAAMPKRRHVLALTDDEIEE